MYKITAPYGAVLFLKAPKRVCVALHKPVKKTITLKTSAWKGKIKMNTIPLGVNGRMECAHVDTE